MQRLIIIRGLPGSGKTSMANDIKDEIVFSGGLASSVEHIEADMFMTDARGHYEYDRNRLRECHDACYGVAKSSLAEGKTVIVANTFVTMQEIMPYIKLGLKFKAHVHIITAQGEYRSVHNVPEEVIARMKARWEP